MQITVVEHPLIKHKLSKMRDVQTTSRDFREWLDEIAMLMTYEVTRDLAVDEMPVMTPICETTGYISCTTTSSLYPSCAQDLAF